MQGKIPEEDLSEQFFGEISSSAKEANEEFSMSLSELIRQHRMFRQSLAPFLDNPDIPSEELKESLKDFLKNIQASSSRVESEWERVKDVLDTVSLMKDDEET